MERLSIKIIFTVIAVLISIFLISFIIFESFYSERDDSSVTFNPSFATPTPEPKLKLIKTPTPIPTPEPTPTPIIPGFSGLFMAELSTEIDESPSNIELVSYEKYIFSNSSLGCPEPGKIYSQVVTPGWIIVFKASNINYEFHSNLDGSYYINCTNINFEETKNISEIFNLKDSQKITIKRFQEGSYNDLKVLNEKERKELIQSLDIPLIKQDKGDCEYLYKLEFNINEKSINMLAICSDGKAICLIEGSNEIYILPEEFLDLIGIHSTGLPFPGKPSLAQ
jgi:hypothetical protein